MPTIEKQVDESLHDSSQMGIACDPEAAYFYFGRFNASARHGGAIFTGLAAIKGQVITAATVQVYVQTTTYDDPDGSIYCEATDAPAHFTTDASDITDRDRSANSTVWQASGIGAGWKTSPDFADAVQEIADRAGFVDELCVLLIGRAAAGSSQACVRQWDYDEVTGAKLSVTHEAPPTLGRSFGTVIG